MGSPFFTDEHSVYKVFIPGHFQRVGKLVEQGSPQIQKDAYLGPGLEAQVDGTLQSLHLEKFTSRSTGPENLKNALEALPIVGEREFSISIPSEFGKGLLDQYQLFAGQCTQAIQRNLFGLVAYRLKRNVNRLWDHSYGSIYKLLLTSCLMWNPFTPL